MEIPGRSLLQVLSLSCPSDLSPEVYRTCSWGGVCFATSLGVQATLFLILSLGYRAPLPPASLTDMGRYIVKPENEIPAYGAGCLLFIPILGTTMVLWNRRLRRAAPSTVRGVAVRTAVLLGSLALVSLVTFLVAVEVTRSGEYEEGRLSWVGILVLGAPAAASAGLGGLSLLRG